MEHVRLAELSTGTIRNIEKQVGARMSTWPEGLESEAELYILIYAAGTGMPVEEVEQLSLRELGERVSLGEDEGTEDPT